MRQDGTTILFGLRAFCVRAVERVAGGGRMVHVLTDDDSAGACRPSGALSSSVRQSRTTGPRDLPPGEQAPVLRWHKVQFSCREQPCPRKAFTERIPNLPAGARLTARLRRHVPKPVSGGAAVSTAAGGLMSWPVRHAASVVHADALLAESEPVMVLDIDETRRGRPAWVQDKVNGKRRLTERFESNFVGLDK